MPRFSSLCRVACFLVLFPTAGVLAQAPRERVEATISVNGTGRVQRTPDFVEVSLGVDVLDPVASEAQARVEQAMKAILESIKALSLAGQELQPGSVELQPR